jgi:hypothetical protein
VTTRSLKTARRHRAELLSTIHCLKHALAAPVSDPGWRFCVAQQLPALRQAFAEHMMVTEGPDGLYAELLDAAPRLARRVHVLTREHAAIGHAIDAVCARVPGASTAEVRGWAGDLLRELSRHRQRGADLVYEALSIDLGGET